MLFHPRAQPGCPARLIADKLILKCFGFEPRRVGRAGPDMAIVQ